MRLGYERPWVANYQAEGIFCDERAGYVEGCTKSGKTAPALLWQYEQIATGEGNRPGCWHLWGAPFHPTALIAYERAKQGIPRDLYEANDSERIIKLAWGPWWFFKSLEKPDGIYGPDYWSAVIEEASRTREEAYTAVRSTLTNTGGPYRAIGNVRGRDNWHYRHCRMAQAGDEPTWHYSVFTADHAMAEGVLDPEEVEQARRAFKDNPAIFRELYYCEPADEMGNPFAGYRDCLGPMSKGEPIAWGWDLAEEQDHTVGVALDESMRVCRIVATQATWDETEELILRETRDALAELDATGVGKPVYERVERRAPMGDRQVFGFKFTDESKQELYGNIRSAIQSREPTIPEGPLMAALSAGEYRVKHDKGSGSVAKVRYHVPPGIHKDHVDAFGLAIRCFARVRHRIRPAQSIVHAPPEAVGEAFGWG